VLSGGDPTFLKRLNKLGTLGGGVDEKLIKGLMAYSKGRSKKARKLLEQIPAERLGQTTGGHLALIQAILAKKTPKKALVYLDQARLMAPGTLIEEAALRRGVVMAAKAGDEDKFLFFVSQYFWRYNKSVYLPNFLKGFAQSFAESKFVVNEELQKRLETFLDKAPRKIRKMAYMALAEAAVFHGRTKLAKMATGKIVSFSKGNSQLATRARLFVAAAAIVTDDYEQALAELKSIDPYKLIPRDRDLLNAALTLAEQLRAPARVSAAQGQYDEIKDASPVVLKGRKSITEADSLLKGAGK
jgi:chemotaxis protein MotC